MSLSLFLFNAASLVEKQQIPIFLTLLWPDRDSNPGVTALEAQQTYNKVYYYVVPRGNFFYRINMQVCLREHSEYLFTSVVIMQCIY